MIRRQSPPVRLLKPRPGRRVSPGWAGAGLALVLLAGGAGCGHRAPVQERQPVPVRVQVVGPAEERRGRRYSATIRPEVDMDLAFKVGGYVEEILQVTAADGRRRPVQTGDRVTRGTVLARVRDSEYRDRLADAEAGLTQARAEYERTARMYENHAASKAEYDAAYARSTSARARYDQAVEQRDDCELRAAMDGILLARRIEIGTLVSPGTPAFQLADTRAVKVIFGVPDVEVVHLTLGAATAITAEAFPGETFAGRVSRVSASADPSTRVFEVECLIPNPGERLRSGMIATLEVPDASGPATPVVPLNAIVRPPDDPAGYAVWIVEDAGGKTRAVSRLVRLGGVVGNAIAVESGLSGGERVIVTGATLVQDQQEVRVIR